MRVAQLRARGAPAARVHPSGVPSGVRDGGGRGLLVLPGLARATRESPLSSSPTTGGATLQCDVETLLLASIVSRRSNH